MQGLTDARRAYIPLEYQRAHAPIIIAPSAPVTTPITVPASRVIPRAMSMLTPLVTMPGFLNYYLTKETLVKAMLHRDKLIGYLFALLIIVFFTGCDSSKQSGQQSQLETQQVTAQILQFVGAKLGVNAYKKLWRMANDSVNYWQQSHLKAWAIDTTTITFRFDTLLCVDSAGDKLMMAHLGKQLTSKGRLDAVAYFYGVKIKEQWYFFSGPTMYLPRTDLQHPTSFSALHEQAVEHIFRAYLKKDSLGQWQINEGFFADLTSRAACPYGYTCQTPQDWDKAYLYWVTDNWKHPEPTKQNQ